MLSHNKLEKLAQNAMHRLNGGPTEWISPSTAAHFIDQLTRNKSNRDMIEFFDFFILPVANPDG